MEADYPSRTQDKKMPVLDTKVWMCEKDGYILYEHFEKDVSNRAVLHSESAEPMSRKRNVHTQEILRRMLNTSPRLVWQEQGAPFIDGEDETGRIWRGL